MRIAVLDDDPILQELLKSTLEWQGHVCRTYSNGMALLRDLRSETFDLIILDWHLPDMQGPEVAQMARKIVGPRLPILFVTRRSAERDVIEGLAHGADDFMTKPLRMGELVARTWFLALSALIRYCATSLCMAALSIFKTWSTNWPCFFFATRGALCRGATSGRWCGMK